jgi:uncharacterized protein YndB with AHSA1/START domain
MATNGILRISPHGDREIVITRIFDAPRQRVFDAFTKPVLLKRWLLGPPDWSLETCDVDLRPGGAYRYVWRSEVDGSTMGMGGVFREIVMPDRIVSTERFDQPWYPGEAVGTLVFDEHRGQTTLTQTLRYESKEARDAVLASNMDDGLGMSYDRLDMLLEPVHRHPHSRAHAHAH